MPGSFSAFARIRPSVDFIVSPAVEIVKIWPLRGPTPSASTP
jgi:hypothetical protein